MDIYHNCNLEKKTVSERKNIKHLMQNGKGDKNRTSDVKKFRSNFDEINWGAKPKQRRKRAPKPEDVYKKDSLIRPSVPAPVEPVDSAPLDIRLKPE